MKIEDRTVVTLSYRLTTKENGQEVEVEKTDAAHPLVFIFGSGNLLPEFEKNLAGKSTGDPFDFFLSAENGYGIYDPKNITQVPIHIFHDESGKVDPSILVKDNVIPMTDHQGNRYMGRVHEITDEAVTMDFNHPLADKELHFVGEVVDVRIATLEELQHGHVHGEGGHHH